MTHAGLSWVRLVGEHGPLWMALGVLVGLAMPSLAALLHPLLVPTLMIPLTLALLRLDWHAIAAYRQHKARILVIVFWLLAVAPVAIWIASAGLMRIGLPTPLHGAVVLMAASSPIVSSVAIALMVGLDATLAVVTVVVTTALVPLTLPVVASWLLGVDLAIEVPIFMVRLAGLVGGAFAAAWLIRRFVPMVASRAAAPWLDAFTVLNLVLFAIAIMDGVTAFALARPAYAMTAVVLAFAANLALQAAGFTVFRTLGMQRALTVGLMSGNCNMGLVLVALQGRGSFDVSVFFALAQLPMYVLPVMLAPLYQRLSASDPTAPHRPLSV